MPRQSRSSLARFFQRRSSSGSGPRPGGGDARRQTMAHLGEFISTRVGVEAYVEPPTTDIPSTVLLVASTGEWTRRRVPDERTAFDIANQLGVPVYNVRFTGYPQRMRDWNSAQRRAK
ncbi:oxidoreductase [Promicromonospora sp. NPDC050880]|uniref:oxidoreductase n=2 Tax=unclassified Promicromonospora TaxID=2647929 RepID=UPI0037A31906